MSTRRCAECDATMYEGGIRAFGQLFCSEQCADDFESQGPPARDFEPDVFEDRVDYYGSLG